MKWITPFLFLAVTSASADTLVITERVGMAKVMTIVEDDGSNGWFRKDDGCLYVKRDNMTRLVECPERIEVNIVGRGVVNAIK